MVAFLQQDEAIEDLVEEWNEEEMDTSGNENTDDDFDDECEVEDDYDDEDYVYEEDDNDSDNENSPEALEQLDLFIAAPWDDINFRF